MLKLILFSGLLVVVLAGIVLLGTTGKLDSSALAVDDDKRPVLPVDKLPDEIDLDLIPNGLEERPKVPAENPLTEAKVRLGRRLFFDPILSENGTVACASCHQPDHGFASPDERAVGLGGAIGKRNAPSLLNRAYGESFLWDGSAKSLEEQVLTPISNPDEFGGTIESVLAALRADETYAAQFEEAFSQEAETDEAEVITANRLAKAIASFERTLILGDSQADRFRDADYSALSKSARQGMWIFESRGRCWKCHSGPNLTDEDFHNTGVGFEMPNRDIGRMGFTQDASDRFKFKTPTLRGVEHTTPFMHDGSIKTLREVVEFYNKGGAPNDKQLDADIRPLKLTDEEVEFLVDFLKAVSN